MDPITVTQTGEFRTTIQVVHNDRDVMEVTHAVDPLDTDSTQHIVFTLTPEKAREKAAALIAAAKAIDGEEV